MRRILFFLFLICFVPLALAEEVRVTSTFDKRAAQVGEEIHLNIRVMGAMGNIQAPRLPAYQGFDTFYTGRASHLTFINGRSSSSVEFSYVLIPKKPGRFNLDPVEVNVEGQSFRTDPIEIQVTEPAGGPVQASPFGGPAQSPQPPQAPPAMAPPVQEPPPSFQPSDDNIFVQATVDKTSVYPNEQILLTYSLYTRYDTRYEGFEEEPQVSGFWIEEFPPDREIRRETVRINGKRYVKADIKKVALFPTTAADYTIQPGTIKVSIRQEPEGNSIFDEFFNDSFFTGGSFFARRENRLLKPPPISITARPFPKQGQPEGFQGAVGNFRMTAAVDKPSVKQNEPVTMKLVLEGEGNIETLNKPKVPDLPDFKIYDADTSSELFKTGDVIGGRKTFEIVFIPIQAGEEKIPKMEFSFFNPRAQSYQTLQTPEFKLQVAPSDQPFQLPASIGQQEAYKKDIQLEGNDIRYIWESLPDQKLGGLRIATRRVMTLLNLLLSLLAAWGVWYTQQEKIFSKNTALRRSRLARSQAESKIRRLKRQGRQNGQKTYFEDVEKILTQYLSDKFNLSAYGLRRIDLERQLEETLGVEDPLYQSILDLYRMCDEHRFGKAELPEELKDRSLKILKETILRVEKTRR